MADLMPALPRPRQSPRRRPLVVVAALLALVIASVLAVTATVGREGLRPAPGGVAFGALPAVLVPGAAGRIPGLDSEAGPPPPPAALSRGTGSRGGVNVPVLMYHYVRVNRHPCDSVGFNLSVSPSDFSAQLDLLAASGYHVVSLDRLMGALLRGQALPPRSLALTFDDGYADFATTAVPILAAHRMTATDFVVPGFLGRPNYMTAEQVAAVAREGFTVGAHTLHHVALATLPGALAAAEISGSRTALELLTGTPVVDFAYPYGNVDTAVEQATAAAGFREAWTTSPGVHEEAARRFALPRVRVGGGESLTTFAASLGIPGAALALARAQATPLPLGVSAATPASPAACGLPARLPQGSAVGGAGSHAPAGSPRRRLPVS